MNPTLLRVLTAICAAATAAASTGAYVQMLPAKYAALAGIALGVVLALKEIAVIVGDVADDGKRNNSFKP